MSLSFILIPPCTVVYFRIKADSKKLKWSPLSSLLPTMTSEGQRQPIPKGSYWATVINESSRKKESVYVMSHSLPGNLTWDLVYMVQGRNCSPSLTDEEAKGSLNLNSSRPPRQVTEQRFESRTTHLSSPFPLLCPSLKPGKPCAFLLRLTRTRLFWTWKRNFITTFSQSW